MSNFRLLYEEYIILSEEESKFLQIYGENLTKLLFIQKLKSRTSNLLSTLIRGEKFRLKNPILDFYQNAIEAQKVYNKNKESLSFDAIELIYKKNILRVLEKLKDTVLLPKISMNMTEKH